MMSKKALIMLADGFEEIEAVTSIDVLRRAGIEVAVCGLAGNEATGAHGLKVGCDAVFGGYDGLPDALVLPGGMPGATNLAASEKLNTLIKRLHSEGKLVAAICASPAIVLAPTGILNGKKATAYPGMEDEFPKEVRFSKDKVVTDGNVITSRGPGTALLFALAIVENLLGPAEAARHRERTLA
jgi:4-methyl-5(b-hydroxyethyl)-thiazole monophosphate biosynthesis